MINADWQQSKVFLNILFTRKKIKVLARQTTFHLGMNMCLQCLLMVRFFHVVEIVSTTCDGVLITSQLVVTTRDS